MHRLKLVGEKLYIFLLSHAFLLFDAVNLKGTERDDKEYYMYIFAFVQRYRPEE